ncbi:MarR family winged helix-turn-helix transcriptional regulator [Carnobacterium mobile]|uniref:MarR family winged helix-turn-helix transcriptional regulator n=1 Tax=Carnobacterium mobile TaxID=2750 RepID=UPI00068C0C77|nr:MarR family transcriptional regulator [Carnobacterium mobile]
MDTLISTHELIKEIDSFQTRYTSIEQSVLKKNRLNRSAFFIMRHLIEQPLTLTELTSSFSLNKSTLSRQVNDLVKKGWVIKDSGKDKRFMYLVLSKEAKQLINSVHFEIEQQVTQIFSSWPNDEKQLFIILLRRINRRIELATD